MCIPQQCVMYLFHSKVCAIVFWHYFAKRKNLSLPLACPWNLVGHLGTVDGSEIPNNHRTCMKHLANNGIFFTMSTGDRRISEPAKVCWCISLKKSIYLHLLAATWGDASLHIVPTYKLHKKEPRDWQSYLHQWLMFMVFM